MTHVFVVNEITFNIHLQYLFAGIGFANFEPTLYNQEPHKKYPYEKTFTGMIADISKVRAGDKVLFYVTGCQKFFGVFQIDGSPFYEPFSRNYLGTLLDNKYLPFRVKIKPYKVYANGISEHLALDDISSINHPYEMCWSMIYRKLTATRGCSFITDYEMSRFEQLLSSENNSLSLKGTSFLYNSAKGKIETSSNNIVYMEDTALSIPIYDRLHTIKGAHEGYVQAFIMQNFDKNPTLISKFYPENTINFWIGNEVICSLGERRIDVLTIAETVNEIQIRIIELKDEYPSEYILTKQLPWYIKWVDQYIAPNLAIHGKPIKLIPTIFAYKRKRNTKKGVAFDTAIVNFNNRKSSNVGNLTLDDLDLIYYDRTQPPINFI